MLHFEGQGYIYKDNRIINKTRDEIIKSGWNNNANIPKVNEILKRFHTDELNLTEMLEYIIRDSESEMKLNSVPPKLSDFGLTEDKIDKINNIEKFLFIVGVVIYFGGAVICVKYTDSSLFINLIHKVVIAVYIGICFFYLRRNKEYDITKKMFKNFKRVSLNYANKYKELEQIAKEKERQRVENEHRRQEELRRQEEKRRQEEELRRQRELREHKNYWYNLDPYEFEEKIGELFEDLGYKVTVTPKSGDGGVDSVIQKDGEIIFVQCKRYNSAVGRPEAQKLWGAKDFLRLRGKILKADKCILVALSGVTRDAKDYIKHLSGFELWTIDTILKMAKQVNYDYN